MRQKEKRAWERKNKALDPLCLRIERIIYMTNRDDVDEE